MINTDGHRDLRFGESGVQCFRAHKEKLLAGYYLCSKENRFQQIVGLTTDNPFADIDDMETLIVLEFNEGSLANNRKLDDGFINLRVDGSLEEDKAINNRERIRPQHGLP